MSLFPCPECTHSVSDKAYCCPACGFPIQDEEADVTQAHPKLPNGFGCIKKLSGHRQRPFAAYRTARGNTGLQKLAIGYYHDWFEAFDALRNYRADEAEANAANVTFREVYDGYYTEKFRKNKKKLSASTRQSYSQAFLHCERLYDRVFRTIRKADLQEIMDECDLGYSTLRNIKKLFTQLYKYASENDIIEKDYSRFVSVNREDDNEKGEPFSTDELTLLWAHSRDPDAAMVLLMIYSGFRIRAFETLEVNLTEGYLRGGVKTTASKNRIVPIHEEILPFARHFATMQQDFRVDTFRKKHFYPLLDSLGIATTANGKKHTPHDCRHTFSWLCDHCHVDDLSKHLLMGHSPGKDIEKSVYGHRTFEELKREIAKLQTF